MFASPDYYSNLCIHKGLLKIASNSLSSLQNKRTGYTGNTFNPRAHYKAPGSSVWRPFPLRFLFHEMWPVLLYLFSLFICYLFIYYLGLMESSIYKSIF